MGARKKEYTIEFNKVRMGPNEFEFVLDDKFLADFEYSPIKKANVEVSLQMIKTENLYDLKFHFEGIVSSTCDTCADEIDIPINDNFEMLMKLSEVSNFEDFEIVYLARTEIEFDLTQYLYESLLLAVPQRKNCSELAISKNCNPEVIKLLGQIEKEEDENIEEESEDKSDPRWNKLKDLLN
jgi:uncharacterized metal-binding protein YceD (DUF177 family)